MSDNRPLVSVCIPVYNCAPFIADAIQSVLDQTLGDFELVIIDNASTDGTVAIARSFSDPRIRILENGKNIGAEGNWNRCLEEARGEFIKLLPADDLLYPASLEKQVGALQAPGNEGISMVCSKRDILSEDGTPIYRGRGLSRSGRVPASEVLRIVARSGGNPLGEPHAVTFRKRDASRVGRFDGSIGYLIDLDYWCRLLSVGDLYSIPEALSAFRVSTGSWSATVAKSQAKETRRFWKRLAEQGRITPSDVRVGSLTASVMGFVRQLVYFRLRVQLRTRRLLKA